MSTSTPQISHRTATAYRSRLTKVRERILLAGDPYCGKTYGWIMMAERAHRDGGEDCPQFWVIDADDAAPVFLGEDQKFAHLFESNGGNVHVYPANEWGHVAGSYRTIIKEAKPQDWLVIDSLTQMYALAQQKTAGVLNFDLDDKTFQNAVNSVGFGAFLAPQWVAVKNTMANVLQHAFFVADFNVLLTTHIKDIVDFHSKPARKSMFGDLQIIPSSPAWIDPQVDTIAVMLKEEKAGVKTKRVLHVVKDRTEEEVKGRQEFKSEWYYGGLQKLRASLNKGDTITMEPDEDTK